MNPVEMAVLGFLSVSIISLAIVAILAPLCVAIRDYLSPAQRERLGIIGIFLAAFVTSRLVMVFVPAASNWIENIYQLAYTYVSEKFWLMQENNYGPKMLLIAFSWFICTYINHELKTSLQLPKLGGGRKRLQEIFAENRQDPIVYMIDQYGTILYYFTLLYLFLLLWELPII